MIMIITTITTTITATIIIMDTAITTIMMAEAGSRD
jgi:hypothetical protein